MPDFVTAFLAGMPPKRAVAALSRRSATTPLDFSHLIPVSGPSAAIAPTASATFAEKMLAADSWTRNETGDTNKAVAGPVQRRGVATGADILAAARAARPSLLDEGA